MLVDSVLGGGVQLFCYIERAVGQKKKIACCSSWEMWWGGVEMRGLCAPKTNKMGSFNHELRSFGKYLKHQAECNFTLIEGPKVLYLNKSKQKVLSFQVK